MSPIIARNPILLTGGAGFIGTNLIKKLLKLGHTNINLLVKKSTNLKNLEDVLSEINLFYADLCDLEKLKEIINKIKPSVIIHLATYSAYRDQKAISEMIETNIKSTLNLLLSTEKIPYKVFINTGSSSEYGIKNTPMKENDILEPISFYAATKASSTLLCQVFAKEYKKPIVTLRPFSVYGPHEPKDRLIPIAIKAIIEQKPINLTPGQQRRDFIYVDDIVNLYLKAMQQGEKLAGQILNMGTGSEYSNDEVINMLFRITGQKVKINKGAFSKRIWDTSHWVADISKTKTLLNWSPSFTLEEGLKKTYLWYKNE